MAFFILFNIYYQKAMANLTIQTIESVNINGKDVINNYTQTIPGINYVDNRNMLITSSTTTNVIYMSHYIGPGQFVTSSFQYGRITNLSSVPVEIMVGSSTTNASFLISSGSSFTLSTSKITGTLDPTFVMDEILTIVAQASGSSAEIEYLVATT